MLSRGISEVELGDENRIPNQEYRRELNSIDLVEGKSIPIHQIDGKSISSIQIDGNSIPIDTFIGTSNNLY